MRFLFVLTIGFCFSCGAGAPPESRSDKLAKSLCSCTSKLLMLNKQAAVSNTDDNLVFIEIAAEYEVARDCVAQLGIAKEDRAGLEKTLAELCPELSAQQELLTELLGE